MINKVVPDEVYKSPYRKVKVRGENIDEHRYIMESHLGRKLNRHEVVHHENGNKLDNRIENLEVMSISEHSRLHNQIYPHVLKCAVCGKEFEVSRHRKGRARVCSEKCHRKINSDAKSVSVIQMSRDGDFIKEWRSATDAAKALRGERTSIVICLKGRTKTALGYKWRYVDERH